VKPKPRKWVSFLLVLAFVFVSAEKCPNDTHPSAPQPAPPPPPVATEATGQVPDPREGDPEPHPKRIVIFRTGVPEENLRPWRVLITTPGGDRPYIDELVVGPEYYTRVLVDANSTAVITVEVKPARKGSKRGFCTIESGNQHDGPRYVTELNALHDGWRVFCYLTLKPMK
jgi:hypothetical protein